MTIQKPQSTRDSSICYTEEKSMVFHSAPTISRKPSASCILVILIIILHQPLGRSAGVI